MSRARVWQFRLSRLLARAIVRTAAALTLGRMPPFVSTSALILEGERVLVVVDPIRGEPVLPGGHLKWAEPPAAGLVREVREETGYDIQPGNLVGAFAGEELAGELGVVRLVYEASVAGGALASSPEGEARWMPLEEIVASATRDGPIVEPWLRRPAPRPRWRRSGQDDPSRHSDAL